jgi:hypothetical protein
MQTTAQATLASRKKVKFGKYFEKASSNYNQLDL